MSGRDRWMAGVALAAVLAACQSATTTRPSGEDPGQDRDASAVGAPGAPAGRPGSGAADGTAAPVRTPAVLTLDEALTLCMQRDPRLEEARARLRALRAQQQVVGRLPNPELVLRAESAPFEGSTLEEAEYLVGLSQPLPLGDRRGRATELARLETEQFEQELRGLVLTVRRDVQGAFATALYAQEAARRREELTALAQEALDIVRVRVESGDAVTSDLLLTELTLVEAVKEQQRATAFRSRALLGLSAAMHRPDLEILGVEGDLSTSLALPSLRALVDDLAEHPVQKAAELRSAAARAEVELREAERIPDVRLELLYRRIESTDTNAFDVGAAIPLLLFNDGRASVEAARSGLDAARAGERRTRQDAELRLRQAHQSLEQALQTQRILEEEVLPRLRARRDQAEARHRLGDLSREALLPVRRAALLEELAALEARGEVMSAWAELSPFLVAD